MTRMITTITRRGVLAVLTVICLCLSLTACGQRIPDYADGGAYEALFTEDDSDGVKEIKSFVIWHIELFNSQTFSTYASQYYGFDDGEQKDMVQSLKATAEQVTTQKTPVYLSAVFLDSDSDRAQVGAVIRTVVTDAQGNTAADYTDQVTYSLYRDDGAWTIEEESTENVGFYQ